MKGGVTAFAAGLVFGIGLIAAGMTNPAKVQAFLDVTGAWDPSLAFVMGGAIAVASLAFAWGRRRSATGAASFSGEPFHWPTASSIDARLVLGGVLFGIGWGIAGFCPGPALVAMGAGMGDAWVFGAAMLGGMALHDRFGAPQR
jgi:uncharacterized membrane protein YedE/YeeE